MLVHAVSFIAAVLYHHVVAHGSRFNDYKICIGSILSLEFYMINKDKNINKKTVSLLMFKLENCLAV